MKSDLKIKEKKLKLTTLGFTLVELLAVIVILAIIALIAIPLIGNVIEKAKIGALENSVNGLVESANMYYANETIKGETISETVFDFEDGEQIGTKKLEYKGKVYNGKLILHTNGEVAVCIDDEEHYAYKNKDTDEIISGVGTCLYDGTTGDFSSNSPVEDLKQQIAAATATSDKVLEGNTIYTSVGLVAGTMTDKSGTTTTATTITENGDNALITIPSSGYYDETSKISVPIETIKSEVSSLNTNYEISRVNTSSISAGSSRTNFLTLNSEGYTTLTFTPYGYANFNSSKFTISIIGANSFNDSASYDWYGNPCSGTTITTMTFTSGQTYSIDISGYKYIYFNASNSNDAYAGAELRHVTLS